MCQKRQAYIVCVCKNKPKHPPRAKFWINYLFFDIFEKNIKMKKLKLLSLLIFPCVLIMTSCGSIQYGKDGGAKTVKMPFAEEDYLDNPPTFYSIQSARGTGSKSNLKERALAKTISELSTKVKSQINKTSNVNLSGEEGGSNSESNNTTISNRLVEEVMKSLILVKSKWLSYGKNASGKEEYEYLSVYKVIIK